MIKKKLKHTRSQTTKFFSTPIQSEGCYWLHCYTSTPLLQSLQQKDHCFKLPFIFTSENNQLAAWITIPVFKNKKKHKKNEPILCFDYFQLSIFFWYFMFLVTVNEGLSWSSDWRKLRFPPPSTRICSLFLSCLVQTLKHSTALHLPLLRTTAPWRCLPKSQPKTQNKR
jgi:hypothetical protein